MSDGMRKLGRGLSALLGDDPVERPAGAGEGEAGQVTMPVEYLSSGRYQPRMEFDREALNDLADSIREKGILQPILVRPRADAPGRFEIIAGERRWRAAQLAQLHEVPVLVRDFTDIEAAEVALIENLQRRDLSALEEAEGYRRLMDEFERSADELSQALGKSRAHVSNMVRLLALPSPVKQMLGDGRLTAGHARALLNATDPVVLAESVVRRGLNVRQTERLATEQGGVRSRRSGGASARPSDKDPDLLALERDLAAVLGLRVDIVSAGRGGSLTLHYGTLEQLEDILQRLNRGSDSVITAAEIPLADDEADAALAAEFAGWSKH